MFPNDLRGIRVPGCTLAVAIVATGGGLQSAVAQERRPAEEMLESVSSRNALCVVMGSEDGVLAVELSRGGKYLVHGLCTHDKAVAQTRAAIAKAQLRGIVSAETGSMSRLPYSDNIVSLVVAENFGTLVRNGLTVKQILRVLRPEGVAWLGSRAAGTNSGELPAKPTKGSLVSTAGEMPTNASPPSSRAKNSSIVSSE